MARLMRSTLIEEATDPWTPMPKSLFHPRHPSLQAESLLDLLPVVRMARLLRVQPVPSTNQVKQLQVRIRDSWDEIKLGYREVIAKAADLEPSLLEFAQDEWVRLHRDGKTPMVDLPRVRSLAGSDRRLDARVCFAVCTDDLSSKIWARVGVPLKPEVPGLLEHDDRLANQVREGEPYSVENLRELREQMSSFRHIARETTNWATSTFESLVREVLPTSRVVMGGALEVSVVTARDAQLKEHLDRLSDYGLTANSLLEDASAVISKYIENAGDLDRPLKSILADGESFWFSTPKTVEHPDGTLDTSQILYLMHPHGETAQTIGIGFADHLGGSHLRDSALDVSRWIANRI